MNHNINVKNISGISIVGSVCDFSNLALKPDENFLAQYHYDMKIAADTHIKVPLAHTKSISEIQATGRKPYKQKGTGHARRGSLVSAINRGGAIAHGPKAKRAHRKVNTRATKKAKRMALGMHLERKTLFVINDLSFESHKTKNVVNFIHSFNIPSNKKCIIIDNTPSKNAYLAIQNIPTINLWKTNSITIHALFKADFIFILQAAFDVLNHSLTN